MKKDYGDVHALLTKLYDMGYRFLARDGGTDFVYAYDKAPVKLPNEVFWFLSADTKIVKRLVFAPDFFVECLGYDKKNIFPTVKWEDGEPTNIKELMKELEKAPFLDWLTRQYNQDARWITRDYCGDIWVYHEKPIKKTDIWDSFDWCASPSYSGDELMESTKKVSFLPRWEDEEPTKIKDIIERYENKGK